MQQGPRPESAFWGVRRVRSLVGISTWGMPVRPGLTGQIVRGSG
jgi:hypothetical protein